MSCILDDVENKITITILGVVLTAALSLLSVSCSSKKESATDHVASARTCQDVMHDMEQVVTPESSACASNDDCACFNLPYKPGTCGVAVNQATNGNMVALAVEAKSLGCALPTRCPTWKCTPHCMTRPNGDGFCTHADPCAELSQKFEDILARGKSSCVTDKDCGTYQAGIAKNCGGVTDKVTASDLAVITKEFFEKKCDYVINCAPRAVFGAACVNSVCIEKSL